MTKSQIPFFAQNAEKMIDNGYTSLVPVLPRTKKPRWPSWNTGCFKPTDLGFLSNHIRNFPNDGIALPCGRLVIGIDLDADDQKLADGLRQIAIEELGETPLTRVGRWPHQLLVYQPAGCINTQRVGEIDILGYGACFVAFGIHPDTGKPYHWLHDDPLNTDVSDLPMITPAEIRRFIDLACNFSGRAKQILSGSAANDNQPPSPGCRSLTKDSDSQFASRIVWDDTGKVTDGREAYLAHLTFVNFLAGFKTPAELANRTWVEFAANADLVRPKTSDPKRRWAYRDALTKAKSTCRNKFYQPLTRPRRTVFDPPQSTPLNSHRRIGYWTPDRKRKHQQEAAHRITTTSVLVVNEAMLAAVTLAAGQCNETPKQIAERIGLGLSTVKAARAELIGYGLWITDRDTYAPIAVADLEHDSTGDQERLLTGGVQIEEDSLYHCSKPREPTQAAVSSNSIANEGQTIALTLAGLPNPASPLAMSAAPSSPANDDAQIDASSKEAA